MTLDEMTYLINGCAMKVHNNLGNGFQEIIYQRALEIELKRTSLKFKRESEQIIYYEGFKIGKRRADFIIEDKIIVELKATMSLELAHLTQAKNYQVAYNFSVGLLINFGEKSLRFHKIYNPRFKEALEFNVGT